MPRLRPARRLAFCLFAVGLGLALCEAGARLSERFSPPRPVDADSPLGFQALPEGDFAHVITVGGRERFHFDRTHWPGQTVAAVKPPGEIRVVLVGGSQALGMGVAPPATFAGILEGLLDRAAGGRRVRLINLAGVGYGSAQLALTLERTLPFLDPDLVITVMGNNEYLDVGFGKAPRLYAPLSVARRLERRFALLRLLRPERKLSEEATPPYAPGMVKASPIAGYVSDRLQRSLARMAKAAGEAGARFLVCSVPVNRRYSFAREWFFAGDTGEQDRDFITARWALSYGVPNEAVRLMKKRLAANEGDLPARLILGLALKQSGKKEKALQTFKGLEEKLRLLAAGRDDFDRTYMLAMVLRELEGPEACGRFLRGWIDSAGAGDSHDDFQLALRGNLFFACGDGPRAGEAFARSLAVDGRPLRADDEINHTLLVTAAAVGAEGFDLARKVERASPMGIPGWEIFLDYCHFNVRGHILAAHLLAPRVAGLVGLPRGFPNAGEMLAAEKKARRGRKTDRPDLAWWAGVDFDATRLVNELLDHSRNAREEILAYMDKEGESALGRVFLGNWMAALPMTEDEISGARPRAEYLRALELDRGMAAAKENLERIEKRGF